MTLVWLPFDPAELGDPPATFDYEVVPSVEHVPASVRDVEIFVPPYSVGPEVRDVLPRMSSLRLVQTLTAGVDNIRDAVPAGVQLCNGRGIHDTSTAELVLTLTLASLRGVPGFVRSQDRHRWDWGWHESLADKTVLIVGYGAIGAAVEARLAPFECAIVRVARNARDGVHPISELSSLLPDADVVVLVLPLTDETRGLADAAFLGSMKEGALLVNVARGPVVDTGALVHALQAGRIRAALDVVDPEPLPEHSPLWDCPGLLISPHVGGSSSAMWPRAYRLVRDQLHRIARGEEPVNIMSGDY
ncbi:MAG TPA: 2-hydroxyacid dehydrogenase [Nocardioides sp.]|uniref:2-hydroxyacid dehydrogenase n=1 Tax=uncultured Nocardioides sp. TaxID=198441 RepID=UPI000EC33685|nr:2-hydroxyacid dehydrogenase [uncultured Nocardioides sp.]HCB03615.1 dihydrofolate reductase [Nocardioides sp.]HRD60833.1 2-hydroxyacid dehydrogenase [Nocardioides sp.]HRI98653.1 2-hydroxyacid dehydrogenase [Nocardioides sp.]